MIGASGKQLVTLLLGGQWGGSAALVPILDLVSAVGLVAQFRARSSRPWARWGGKVVIHLVQLIVLIAGTSVALLLRCGVHGLMVAVLVSCLVKQVLFYAWLDRLFPASRRLVAQAYAQAAALTALIWLALWAVQQALEGRCPVALVLAAQWSAAGVLMLGCVRYGAGLHGMRVARERGLLPGMLSRMELKRRVDKPVSSAAHWRPTHSDQ
ncbi:hypothetical protein GCM10010339_55580 [Streptomyces alanosinicus]|uniref:Uncharacterized protein n=1 Tax=Streptomyces alanosinicus TaxID=68171 RepID=A0A918YMK1_9ACTN|nr:hypothetical protein GCM10010339_55580 [Streptomyces alanosinicus]